MTDVSPIEILGLRKEFGSFVAVDNLDLKIKKNSFTGLLGPNGAGKSTSLKILTNLITATSGNAYINGIDVTENPKMALKRVGTVVETPEFYSYLTPRETMEYVGELLGMNRESIADQTETILSQVKMTEWADKKIGTFSKGMRQRIAIGQSLMNNPNVIILDEPTSGLDPRGMAEMREILRNLRNVNHDLTILMSSHMMHEVTDLCDRVAIMNHGKLLIHDDIEKITEIKGARTIIIKTVSALSDDCIVAIQSLKHVVSAKRDGTDIVLKVEGEKAEQAELFREMCKMSIGVYSLSEYGNALESSYLDLIKESK